MTTSVREPDVQQGSSLPYVVPFVVFMALLAAAPWLLPYLGAWEYVLRVVILSLTLWFFSRNVIDFRTRALIPSVILGIAVFALWIAPDVLFPGYRQHWLFDNALTGGAQTSVHDSLQGNSIVLIMRALRAVVLVPVIEELFWRAWLMRWLINPDFERVPLGAFSWSAMIISAALFASEHGAYWDVGLVTGFLYNWWMVRTKSLGDCIVAHAVTNACLSAYVVAFGRWEYWL
jgi:CAAX prenyl protease-like protein